MLAVRVIPCLLYKGKGLVKTVKFSKTTYVGDPINAIKIFNEKQVDELVFLDIDATKEKRKPNFKLIEEIAGECFMPLCYGGGLSSVDDIRKVLSLGVEKVIINTQAVKNPDFIKEAVQKFGSSTIVISVDYKNNFFGNISIYTANGSKNAKVDPIMFAEKMQELGAGEVMFNCISRDGMMDGYDVEFLERAVKSLKIPVIACGGAGKVEDLTEVVKKTKVAAVAAGSLFVFYGPHKAVLINYPNQKKLKQIVS